jgi:hypothetical protein
VASVLLDGFFAAVAVIFSFGWRYFGWGGIVLEFRYFAGAMPFLRAWAIFAGFETFLLCR